MHITRWQNGFSRDTLKTSVAYFSHVLIVLLVTPDGEYTVLTSVREIDPVPQVKELGTS